ncbi:hypothetical protein [Nostoc sp.]
MFSAVQYLLNLGSDRPKEAAFWCDITIVVEIFIGFDEEVVRQAAQPKS